MNIKNIRVRGMIHFPCHTKEKVLVYEDASGCCSMKCPYCERFALFDFDNMKASQIKACRGLIHKIKQNNYID